MAPALSMIRGAVTDGWRFPAVAAVSTDLAADIVTLTARQKVPGTSIADLPRDRLQRAVREGAGSRQAIA
jgi:hypothetical protein